jgi:hypothetical protein
MHAQPKPRRALRALALAATLVGIAGSGAFAQQPAPEEEARSTGLPKGINWTFNLDASWGNFGFMNSLYTNPKPDEPSGNLGDNWFEGAVKPALTGSYTTRGLWTLWGKVSAVGERTYGASPSLVGEDASSFKAEDLAFGIKSGKALDFGEDALEFTVGRAPYQLGHGFLVWDGAAEGGTRGGYWTNARKAFAFTSIARVKTKVHKVEVFYLKRDELPEADTNTRLSGVNYEASLGESTTLGGTYLKFWANDLKPERNGLGVVNLRAHTAPFPSFQGLSFELEYARERNGDLLDSHAWTLQGAYEFAGARWKPKVSYRYALFQGDDPATAKNEAWDALLSGFYDWGSWWQGEIAGEYFVSNSNLASHQVRLHLAPTEKIGTGVIGWDFLADQPGSVGPGVTARDIAFELDWYMDWKLNKNFTASFVAAFANPGAVVEQNSGRTKNFGYGMIYFAYSY